MTEVVAAPVAPVPGTPEHDAAMAAKFDKHQSGVDATVSPDAPVKPEHVPDKFWNVTTGQVDYAAWAKSTSEAEAKLTELAQKAKSGEAPQGAPQGAEGEADAAAQLADKGLDLTTFTQEFAQNGSLSDDAYTKLAKAGYSKEVVDNYIEGRIAVQAAKDAVGYEVAGGKDKFQEMGKWAAANMTPAEINAFNAALAGSTESMKLAVLGLKTRYEQANGADPKLLGGARGVAEVGYESMAQVTAAMKDPRYKTDPAYRKAVERKIGLMA